MSNKYDPDNAPAVLRSIESYSMGGGRRTVFNFHPDAAAAAIEVATRPFCLPLSPNSPGATAARAPSPVATFRYQTRKADALRYLAIKSEDALELHGVYVKDEYVPDEILARTTYSRRPASLSLPEATWNLEISKLRSTVQRHRS